MSLFYSNPKGGWAECLARIVCTLADFLLAAFPAFPAFPRSRIGGFCRLILFAPFTFFFDIKGFTIGQEGVDAIDATEYFWFICQAYETKQDIYHCSD